MTSKNERQKSGIKKFIANNHIGILKYVMGFGKTLTAIKIIDYYINVHNKHHILVIVPSVAIKTTWVDELNNYVSHYNTTVLNNIVIVETINIVLKYKDDIKYDLLIIDEIHKYTSDIRYNFLKNIKYNAILGLTGSPVPEKITDLVPIIDDISELEAIRNKWISNFKEFNIHLSLTEDDTVKYIKYSETIKNVLDIFKDVSKRFIYSNGNKIFNSDFDLVMACYHGKKIANNYVKSYLIRESVSVKMGYEPNLDLDNPYYSRIDKYWKPEAIESNVRRFYNAMVNRNTIHNFNEVKLNAVLELYKHLSHKKIITFSESINMAEAITDAINNFTGKNIAISYHSKIKSKPLININTNDYFRYKNGKIKNISPVKQLDYIKDSFNANILSVLNTVNAVNEGFNLEILEIVITTSGSTNPTQYAQRSGRGIRLDYYNPNKITFIINLYFDDFMYNKVYYKSRDKSKLKMRQSNKYIPSYTIEEFIDFVKYLENIS